MARTRVVILSISILLMCSVILMLVPYLIDENFFKDFFLHQLEESIGRKIDVHRIKLVLLPRIRLEMTDVVIHDLNSDELLLSAKKFEVVLRIFPLLQQKVVAKRVFIKEPTITFRRRPSGGWNYLEHLRDDGTVEETAPQASSIIFLIREARIEGGTVHIIDEKQPDGPRSIIFELVEGSLILSADRRQTDLHILASHLGRQGLSSISLNGMLTPGHRQRGEPNESLFFPSLEFEGKLDATNLDLQVAVDFFGPRPVPVQLQESIDIHSRVRVIPGVVGYDVLLSDLSASLEQLHLSGQASFSGLLSPQPTFALSFAAPSIQLSQMVRSLPAEWIHAQLPEVIRDRQINGMVEIISATVTGTSAAGPEISMTGQFRVTEGRALIGISRVLAQDLSANISVEAGRIKVSDLNGLYGKLQMHGSKGQLNFLTAGLWLEMDISGTMIAPDLLESFAVMVTSESLAHELRASRDIHGLASVTFRLVGLINQPGGLTFSGGEIRLEDLSLTHPLFPERVTALQGRLIFSDGKTLFDHVTGQVGTSVFHLNGKITGETPPMFQSFSISIKGGASAMGKLFAPTKPTSEVIDGPVEAALILSGPLLSPHVRGEIILTQAKVLYAGFIDKPMGAQASVKFDGSILPDGGIELKEIELTGPSFTLQSNGKIHLGKRFLIDATLTTERLSVTSVPRWIILPGLETGKIELSLELKGKDLDWKTWQTTGWVALTDGRVRAKNTEGLLEDIYMRVHFVPNGVEIKQLSFRLLDSDLAFKGVIHNWPLQPSISATIQSNQMDLDLLIPKGDRSAIRELLEFLAATTIAEAMISIKHAHYQDLPFESLSARMRIKKGVIEIDGLSSHVSSGKITGGALVHLPRYDSAQADISMQMKNVLTEDLLKIFGITKDHVSGVTSIFGTISGDGENPLGITPTLSGKIDLLLENGRIFKSDDRFIWKILSLLNLPALLKGQVDLEKNGLPFTKISATALVRKGQFETENLIINSPILKITAAGTVDLPTSQVNMVWAISPFGSYSQLLKDIPLLGRIFAGDRKGLATALFSVKGPLDNPEVTYLPLQSFTAGLTGVAELAVHMLKNIVLLPIDLFKTKDEQIPTKNEIVAPDPVLLVP